MAASLIQMLGVNNPDFYNRSFRRVVEDHLAWLVSASSNNFLTIKGDEGIRYEGDLFSLLRSRGVQRDMWWPMMRVNGMQSPRDYRQDMLTLYIVDEVKLSKLLSVWRTYQNTSK